MAAFIARRVVQSVPVLLLLTVIAFCVTMLLPGDPALAILGVERAKDDSAYQALRKELGLDRPLPVQYAQWLAHTARGDFGRSAVNHQPVAAAIRQRLPVTLELGLLSMLVSVLIAVPFGIVAAVRANRPLDLAVSLLSIAGVAVPGFWLAILAIWFFTQRLGWLPGSGYVPLTEDVGSNIKHMIMPVAILSAESAAGLMRQVRSAMLEVLGEDYIRTGRAKGLREVRVLGGHALRNALIPVVTIIGLRVGRLIAGAVVVESVFALPGLGRLAVESIFNRDYPVIQAIVLLAALAVLLANLATDLLYGLIDPRIRYA
jgi:peptide/nickel transport system permease protein